MIDLKSAKEIKRAVKKLGDYFRYLMLEFERIGYYSQKYSEGNSEYTYLSEMFNELKEQLFSAIEQNAPYEDIQTLFSKITKLKQTFFTSFMFQEYSTVKETHRILNELKFEHIDENHNHQIEIVE